MVIRAMTDYSVMAVTIVCWAAPVMMCSVAARITMSYRVRTVMTCCAVKPVRIT